MTEPEPWLPSPVPGPRGYWLKRLLSRLTVGSRLGTETETGDTRHWFRERIIVALLVLAALVVMGLLFLLNYKCIMVWHLCYEEDEHAEVLSFGED